MNGRRRSKRIWPRSRCSREALSILPEVFGDVLGKAEPPAGDGSRELTPTFQHDAAAAHRLADFGGLVEVLEPGDRTRNPEGCR
jgi:hypothetical protein